MLDMFREWNSTKLIDMVSIGVGGIVDKSLQECNAREFLSGSEYLRGFFVAYKTCRDTTFDFQRILK